MAYRGQVASIELGAEGLTGSTFLAGLRPGQLLQATNVSFDDGAIRKEGGAVEYTQAGHSLGGITIIGGVSWNDGTTGLRDIVYGNDGVVRKDTGDGKFSVSLKTGLNTDCIPVFTEAGSEVAGNPRKLFLCNQNNNVNVLSGGGSTMNQLALPAADWATDRVVSMTVHEGRLWAAAGHNVYYSIGGDHEDFQGGAAGFFKVYPGEGTQIAQILSFKHLLVILKRPRGVYAIDTSSASTADWAVSQISAAIGGVSQLCAVGIENDILFVDQNMDVQLLSGIQEFGELGMKNISQVHQFNQFMRTRLDLNRKHKTRVIYYSGKREIHIAVTQLGQTWNHARVVVDLNRLDLARFRWSPRDQCEGIWLRRTSGGVQYPMVGETGKIYTLDQPSPTKDGVSYRSAFATPHLDFSHLDPSLAGRRKNGQFLELVVSSEGAWKLDVDVVWDGQKTHTIPFTATVRSGCTLGSWILGTSAFGGTKIQTVRKRVVGSGRRIQLIFVNHGSAENFSLSGAYLSFQPSDQATR